MEWRGGIKYDGEENIDTTTYIHFSLPFFLSYGIRLS